MKTTGHTFITRMAICILVVAFAFGSASIGPNKVMCFEPDGTISVQYSSDGVHCAHSMASSSETDTSGSTREPTVRAAGVCMGQCVDVVLAGCSASVPPTSLSPMINHPVEIGGPHRGEHHPCLEYAAYHDCTRIAPDILRLSLLSTGTVRLLV